MRYNILYLMISLMAVGCTSADEPVGPATPEAPDEARITVCGSTASMPMSSRATAPALDGVCYADRMQIDIYYAQSITNVDISKLNKHPYTTTLTLPEGGASDKSCSHEAKFTVEDGYRFNYVAFAALSYTEADKELFSYTTGSNPTASSLSLSAACLANETVRTPELFFGLLQSKNVGGSSNTEYGDYSRGYSGSRNLSMDLHGDLYRIVGQINLQISEILATVERIELFAEDLPKTIKLAQLQKHGTLYPVEAVPASATDATVKGWTKIASKSRAQFADDGSTTLSSFILPSTKGCRLKMKAHYKGLTDEGNDTIRIKEYDLRPANSVVFADNDKMYTSETLKASETSGITSFYVYNNTTYRFFPFSNVRLNLKGNFDKVAFDSQEVKVEIEVEPGFVRKHEFTVK